MQGKLFFDDEYEALNLMISNSERSFKEVAGYLFPHMKPDSAYARLKSCLNQEKDERLTFGQIIAAMNFCGSYEPIMYACDETLHARPDRKSPSDEKIRLVETIKNATDAMNQAIKKLEHLDGGK